MSETPPPPPPPSGSEPPFQSPPPPPPSSGFEPAPYAAAPPPPPPPAQYPPPPPPVSPYQTGSAYPGQPQFAGAGQPADLMPRFLAKLIDGLVMAAVNFVVAFVLVRALGGGFIGSAIGTVVTTAFTLGYYAFLESSRGQTLGKMVLGLKVQNLAGQNPTMEEALKRNAYFAISILGIVPFLGTFVSGLASLAAAIYIAVTINGDTQLHRGWHDIFGGTQVIKAR